VMRQHGRQISGADARNALVALREEAHSDES
jgi:hypothetical protein